MGESISEVVVGRFLQPSGGLVRTGEDLIELETEKVNQVLTAPTSGRIEWIVQEGQTLAPGGLLGVLHPQEVAAQPPKAAKEPPKAVARAAPAAPPPGESLRQSVEEWVRHPVVPLAPVQAAESDVSPSAESEERRPMSKLRKTIARRLVEVQQTTASLTTFNECDMSRVMELRTRYKEKFQKDHGVGLGFMSFFIKAVVDALHAYPDFHAYIEGEEIVTFRGYDISIAVSTDRGLVVPVLRDCDRKSFADVESELAEVAARARASQLTLSDLKGGCFTISNAGGFGSLLSTPILNAPQVGILGMHKIQERPVAVDGKVEIRPMMYLALTYDHRMVDGKEAVSFLVHVKNRIEDPSRLMLEV